MAFQVDHPKTIKDELHRFLMFSTVRGAGRTLRARSKIWSVLWAVSVLAFCAISLVFIRNLIYQYYFFNTLFQTTYHFRSDIASFPSVTVCNLQPLSKELIDRIQNQTKNSEKDLIANLTHLRKYTNDHSSSSISTKSFFLQNLDSNTIKTHGLQFDEFILPETCNFTYNENKRIKSGDCKNFDIIMIPDPNLFQCFMISPSAAIANKTYSLEMDIYLNTEQSVCEQANNCSNHLFGLEDSVGAHVVVHTAGTYPEVSQRGIHIHPGTKTTIEIMETRLERLDRSLQDCTDQNDMPLVISDKTVNFAYKTTVCQRLQIQKRLAQKCKCIDPAYPVNTKMKNLPYCAELSGSGSMDRYLCSTSVDNIPEIATGQGNMCKKSCDYISYKTTTFQSQWPPKHNELDFYKLRLQNQSIYGSKFKDYETILTYIAQANYSEAISMLRDTNLISENFVRLKVFRPEISLTESVEQLQITPEALISQIGGAFSLWCGVTVITLIEILEFVYYIIKLTGIKVLTQLQNKNDTQNTEKKYNKPNETTLTQINHDDRCQKKTDDEEPYFEDLRPPSVKSISKNNSISNA